MRIILVAVATLAMFCTDASGQTIKRTNRKYRKHKPVYYNSNHRTQVQTDATRPSPYKGDKVPENDGVKKNAQRNINYNNGQPMPSNSGK
jgi:hypothetical protein